ncbi:MAG TPA: four helix bundle protein [Chthoniobacterales bacterium]
MDEIEFKRRTKEIGLRVIRLIDALPNSRAADVLGRQLLRSATSIGSNYRAACRAKSRADMLAKLAIVEEEADETLHWLEMLGESGIIPAARISLLGQEVNEVIAMVVASIKTLRR